MNSKEKAVKRLSSIVALGLMAFSLIACSGTTAPPTTTPTPITTENKQLNSLDEITPYYPEIAGLPAKVDKFETENSSVTVFNFDPSLKINTTAMTQVFSFFENLARSKQAVKYPLGNKVIDLSLNPQSVKKTLFVVIPETAPNPKWLGLEHSIADTATLPDINITIVRNINPKLLEQYLNVALSTGVCKSTIQVTSNDPKGMLIGEDVTCNSLGAGYYLDSETYKKYAGDVNLPDKGLNLLKDLPREFNKHQSKKMVTPIY